MFILKLCLVIQGKGGGEGRETERNDLKGIVKSIAANRYPYLLSECQGDWESVQYLNTE